MLEFFVGRIDGVAGTFGGTLVLKFDGWVCDMLHIWGRPVGGRPTWVR